MKRNSVLALSAFMIFAFASFAGGIKFEKMSLEEAMKKAQEENKIVFIDVFATWCGPCKYLTREVFTEDELGEFMNDNFINIKLDGELPDGESLMIDFELDSYPTMLFLSSDKTLLKKIVGAVESHEIISTGKAVLDPESTEIFKATQRFNSGERHRDFLGYYLSLMIEEDIETDSVVSVFLELYPELDLGKENEFLVFCLGVTDLDHELSNKFIENISYYSELHPGYTEAKMKIMLIALAEEAEKSSDDSIIDRGVERLYEPFTTVFGNDIGKDELIEALKDLNE